MEMEKSKAGGGCGKSALATWRSEVKKEGDWPSEASPEQSSDEEPGELD